MTPSGFHRAGILTCAVAAFTHGSLAQGSPHTVTRAGDDRCDAPSATPSLELTLPGTPFQALPTADGCHVIVSLPQTDAHGPSLAIVTRRGGILSLERLVAAPGGPTGMSISHDGRWLAVAAGESVLVYDVAKLLRGATDALAGSLGGDLPGAGRVYAAFSPDDRLLFVSDERAQGITVLDAAASRVNGFTKLVRIGRIPTGRAPIALTFSPDGRWLYTTSQVSPDEARLAKNCRPQTDPGGAPDHATGAIVMVDVARAAARPDSAVVAVVPAGCNPVRLYVSASGDRAWVTARGENAVLLFDVTKFRTKPDEARLARIPVGTAPVGIVGVLDDRRIIATNSNRFAGGAADRQALSVIDPARAAEGAAAVVGEIPAGGFPRELRVTADGRTLVLTNFSSRTLQLVDLARAVGLTAR